MYVTELLWGQIKEHVMSIFETFKDKKWLLLFLEYSKSSPYVSVPVKMGQFNIYFIHHMCVQKVSKWKDLSLSILKWGDNQSDR